MPTDPDPQLTIYSKMLEYGCWIICAGFPFLCVVGSEDGHIPSFQPLSAATAIGPIHVQDRGLSAEPRVGVEQGRMSCSHTVGASIITNLVVPCSCYSYSIRYFIYIYIYTPQK